MFTTATRRWGAAVAFTAAAALVVHLPPTNATQQPPAAPVASLHVDGTAFWDGTDWMAGLAAPTCTSDPCWDFAIDVEEPGWRLRVALDTPGNVGTYTVALFDPAGVRAASDSGPYSMEAFVADPEPGRWIARATGGPDTGFRMRAKLESVAPERIPDAETGLLLPNLQLIPPYEFTFHANATQPSTGPIVAGRDPTSCKPYEAVEYAARRCLRFSLGPMNVGDGPLVLRVDADPVTGTVGAGPVTQLVSHVDGSVVERPAGGSVFHATHSHFHHNGFGTLELLKVLDPTTGAMVAAGGGPKQGFCMLDYQIPQWGLFRNDPPDMQEQDCLGYDPTGLFISLGTGWGDIYKYSLDGNYVEFRDNPEGLYVVRSVADAFNDVLESDETDNAGYAYIRITANDVEVLERGHGLGPWDPEKVLADDILPDKGP